jgi:hypothetical protein
VGARHGLATLTLVGRAPKFERQPVRRLESYGVVATAFNRFPDLQLQVVPDDAAPALLSGRARRGVN